MKTKITVVSTSVKSGTAEKSGKDWALFSIYDGENWFTFFSAEWNSDLQNLEEGDEVEVYYIVEKYKGKSKNVIVPASDPRVATEKMMEEKFIKIENRLEISEVSSEDFDNRIDNIEEENAELKTKIDEVSKALDELRDKLDREATE